MAQPLVREFVRQLAEQVELPDPIVEFGALKVDQHGDLRPLFPGRAYIGTDMRAGPGVDRIEDLRELRFGDGEVGTALCLDTLEHCADPPQAVRELARVTATGGVCVLSSVMLFGIHAHPDDYFRFTPSGMRELLVGFDDVWTCGVGHPGIPFQVLGVGAKQRTLGLARERFPILIEAQKRYEEHPGEVRIGVLNHRPGEVARALVTQLPRLAGERLRRSRA